MANKQLIETHLDDKKTIIHDSKSSAIVTLDREKDLKIFGIFLTSLSLNVYGYDICSDI